MKLLKYSGSIEKIGVSIYSPIELDYINQILDFDIVQAPLNLIDRRLKNSGWLNLLYAQGIEVHTRSAFLQGLLMMSRQEIPPKFERWAKIWDSWHAGLTKEKATAAKVCLSYPLHLSEVKRVIVGVDSMRQFTELIHESYKKSFENDWDFMISEDEDLINPSNWNFL